MRCPPKVRLCSYDLFLFRYLENKKKYIVIGEIFILIVIIAINLALKSYALESFGKIDLTCDKTIATYGENIKCTITGTVDSTSYVSAVASNLLLYCSHLKIVESNLKLVNITDLIYYSN